MKGRSFFVLFAVLCFLIPGVPCRAETFPGEAPEVSLQRYRDPGVSWDEISVLNLETSQNIVLSQNPTMAAAEERVLQARQQVKQARASFFPRVDAEASFAHVRMSDRDIVDIQIASQAFNPLAAVENPEDYFSAGISGVWLIFDGLAREYTYGAARDNMKGTREGRMETARRLFSSVAGGYYAAQLGRMNIAIAEADVEFNERLTLEAKARRRVGTGSLSDELNFEVQANAARSGLIDANFSYETARIGLAALLGIPGAMLPPHVQLAELPDETPQEMKRPDPGPLFVYAMQHRTDLLQARYGVDQARKGVGVARARFFPVIDLGASFTGERPDTAALDMHDFGDSVFVRLSYNLFAGGSDAAGFCASKARKRETEREMENLELSISSEVRQALSLLSSAQDELRLQRANSKLVRENRELVEKEYNAGQASLVRLNEAQRDLIRAQSRLALALVSLRKAWFDVKTSTAQSLIPFREKLQ
jgi:outer membrane protein TolC